MEPHSVNEGRTSTSKPLSAAFTHKLELERACEWVSHGTNYAFCYIHREVPPVAWLKHKERRRVEFRAGSFVQLFIQ